MTGSWPKDTLERELRAATSVLGIPQSQVIIRDYRVRHFSEARQQIPDDLIRLEREIRPDIVFLPSLHDIHQDHATIAALRNYASQRSRQYTQEENILALLRTHGMQIGEEFAEMFEVPRIIIE